MDQAGYRYYVLERPVSTGGEEEAGGGLCLRTLFMALIILGGNAGYLKRKY
jgi:hypothetical protein